MTCCSLVVVATKTWGNSVDMTYFGHVLLQLCEGFSTQVIQIQSLVEVATVFPSNIIIIIIIR